MNLVKKVIDFVMDILETVVFIGSLFIVIYLFVMAPNQVKGASMEPTFRSGEYILTINSEDKNYRVPIFLNNLGQAPPLEARYLIPDYTWEFTLSKPFYKPKTIRANVYSGINQLDFGKLEPDLGKAFLNPQAFWQLLPFSPSI